VLQQRVLNSRDSGNCAEGCVLKIGLLCPCITNDFLAPFLAYFLVTRPRSHDLLVKAALFPFPNKHCSQELNFEGGSNMTVYVSV
jgi:hypothetical protein